MCSPFGMQSAAPDRHSSLQRGLPSLASTQGDSNVKTSFRHCLVSDRQLPGQSFQTIRGVEFTYEVDGNILRTDRKQTIICLAHSVKRHIKLSQSTGLGRSTGWCGDRHMSGQSYTILGFHEATGREQTSLKLWMRSEPLSRRFASR
jgi:hypothetical protein